MGQTNTERISHNLATVPVWGRADDAQQLLNDLFEEDSGKGYSQVIRTGPFVTTINVWSDNTMTLKRSDTVVTRTGSFISSIVKKTYNDEGIQVSTITATVTRAGDNSVSFVNVAVTRP